MEVQNLIMCFSSQLCRLSHSDSGNGWNGMVIWNKEFTGSSDGYSPIPVVARSQAWVCGRSLAGIVGLNPADGMDVFLFFVFCVVR
jgi:hypothetical protein